MLTQTRITRQHFKGKSLQNYRHSYHRFAVCLIHAKWVPLKMRMFLFHGLLILDDLQKKPSGANVSYDGALAFMTAEYVSSEELRCRIPPQAMTLRPWNVFSFMSCFFV